LTIASTGQVFNAEDAEDTEFLVHLCDLCVKLHFPGVKGKIKSLQAGSLRSAAFASGHGPGSGQACAAHESRDVLQVFLAAAALLVRLDHGHADAHEVRVPDASV
jgi:hypothetical protein